MSHPAINRWGTNLFWYNYWYADKLTARHIQQDSIFIQLVNCYIIYGLFYKKNPFLNFRFYLTENLHKDEVNFLNYEKYFHTSRYRNIDDENIEKYSYARNRKRFKHIYYSRVWLFKYQDWIIIYLYAYKPSIKKYKVKKKKFDFNYSLDSPEINNQKILLLIRYKLFLTLNNKFFFLKKINYAF